MFPPLGESSSNFKSETWAYVKVIPVPCLCMGLDKPHEQYRINSIKFGKAFTNRGLDAYYNREDLQFILQTRMGIIFLLVLLIGYSALLTSQYSK
jgi:hypothetical protein